MQSFSSFLFSDNACLNSRCQCCTMVLTYAVAPSSVRTGCWQMQAVLPGRLVLQKCTYKCSSSNIISLTRINCCKLKSQFDILFTSRKTQLNITSYIWSKLNREFQIFQSIGKCQVHIHRAQLFKCWDCMLQFSSKHFVSPPSPNPHKAQHKQCNYKIKFRRNL